MILLKIGDHFSGIKWAFECYHAKDFDPKGDQRLGQNPQSGNFEVGLKALSGEYELRPSPLSGEYKVALSPLRGEIDVGLSPLRGEIDVGLSPLSGEFAPQWTRLLGSHFLIMLSPLSGPPVYFLCISLH